MPSIELNFTPPPTQGIGRTNNCSVQRIALEPPQEPVIEVRDMINLGDKPRVLVESPDVDLCVAIPIKIKETSKPHIFIQTPLSPLVDASDSTNPVSNLSKVWSEKEIDVEFSSPPKGIDLTGKTPSVCLEPPQPPGAMLDDVANMGSAKVKKLQETMIGVVWAQHNQGFDKMTRHNFHDPFPLQPPTIELEDKAVALSIFGVKRSLEEDPNVDGFHFSPPQLMVDSRVQRPSFLVMEQLPRMESVSKSKEVCPPPISKKWSHEESMKPKYV